MKWTVEALNERVAAEIAALAPDMQARYGRIADLLIKYGPQEVGMPYVRPLGGKLWEIRLRGRTGIARIIYVAASRQRLILLHAFIKKSQETPARALAIARSRLREVLP